MIAKCVHLHVATHSEGSCHQIPCMCHVEHMIFVNAHYNFQLTVRMRSDSGKEF
jgi:hypothetical protein